MEVRTLAMELRRRRDTQAITFQRTTEQWKCVLRLNEPARIDNMPESPMLLLLACESVASVVAEREEVSEAVQVDVAAAAVGSGARGAVVTLAVKPRKSIYKVFLFSTIGRTSGGAINCVT